MTKIRTGQEQEKTPFTSQAPDQDHATPRVTCTTVNIKPCGAVWGHMNERLVSLTRRLWGEEMVMATRPGACQESQSAAWGFPAVHQGRTPRRIHMKLTTPAGSHVDSKPHSLALGSRPLLWLPHIELFILTEFSPDIKLPGELLTLCIIDRLRNIGITDIFPRL